MIKRRQHNILSSVAEYEPLSAYDMAKLQNADYGNTNRNVKELIKIGYLQEAGRVKGVTNNERILYDLTNWGVLYYLLNYIIQNQPESYSNIKSKRNIHKDHIVRIILRYSQYFPILSNNIEDFMSDIFHETNCFDFDIAIDAIVKAAGKSLVDDIRRKEHSTDSEAIVYEITDHITEYEKKYCINLNKPKKSSLIQSFEDEFIRCFILESPVNTLLGTSENILLEFRLSEIFQKSEELKAVILDYFKRKESYYKEYVNYYKEYVNYYQSLSEIN